MLTRVRAYIDVNHTRNLAVIMVPGNQKRWLYVDQTAEQVRDLLAQNNATLIDLSSYPGPLDSVRYAIILEPSSPPNPSEWWGDGLDANGIGQMLKTHPGVQLTLLSPYYVPSYTP